MHTLHCLSRSIIYCCSGAVHHNGQDTMRMLQDKESSEGRSKLPQGFPVILLHDLVDGAQVGDSVEVTGVILQQVLGAVPNGAI